MARSIDKHITLYDVHDDILKHIMDTQPGVKNYSEAVRFLCLNYDPELAKSMHQNQAKLNAIGKELSIVTEIVSEFADIHLDKSGILIGKNSKVFKEAKEKVEARIKKNQTQKYSGRPFIENKEPEIETNEINKDDYLSRLRP